jgi:hypothetical protein
MHNLRKITPLSVAVLALGVFGLYTQSADAQVACCRIMKDGNLIVEESSPRCNDDTTQTRNLNVGNYEVDFIEPLTDVRPFVKLLTLDTQVGGSVARQAGVSDRAGDVSSVFVKIRDNKNKPKDEGFNLCLF